VKRLPIAALASVCLTVVVHAEIGYTVAIVPDPGRLVVTVKVPVTGPVTEFQMPRWAPGAYVLRDFANGVSDFAAQGDGKVLDFTKPDANTWRVNSKGLKEVVATYSVGSVPIDGVVHYSGPSTYMYVVGRKQESCLLGLDTDWPVAVGLNEVPGQTHVFKAHDYDTLADNPVSAGAFRKATYVVKGKLHEIVLRNRAKADVDLDYLTKACRHITEAQVAFWGAMPYDKYVWHFAVNDAPDGAGGLEHLSSTQISLGSGIGPSVVHLLSHEFFHLWNVKRVRSAALGPFDYLQLPKTGALWWLEGVTDYYSNLLLARFGWESEETFYDVLLNNVNAVRRNQNRLRISAFDASYRVGEAAGGRGNSNGYLISYYDLGWVVGLLLDIEIRYRSLGRHSLDDVARALWAENRDFQPGFDEDRIRRLCVRYGGPTLNEFYNQVVRKPGEIRVEEQLAKVGLMIGTRDEPFVDWGFDWNSDREQGYPRVRTPRGPGRGVLESGDILMRIANRMPDGRTNRALNVWMTNAAKRVEANEPLTLRIKRDTRIFDVVVTPTQEWRKVPRIVPSPEDDAAKTQLRWGWIYGGDPHLR